MRVLPGYTLVVGLGISGRAISRYLARKGKPFVIADTRDSPPGIDEFQRAHPGIEIHCGPLSEIDLSQAEEVVLSPGIDPHTPGLQGLGHRLVGEIALFVRDCTAPIAAITGSNAKSTVTTLLGEMAREAGRLVAVGGNLGTPALDLLHEQPNAELYVLELSSFQLETTPWLGAQVAAFLNLSEDHLDRHDGMAGYRAAKLAIFRGAHHAIINAEDPMTWPVDPAMPSDRFTASAPTGDEWGVANHDNGGGDEPWLMRGDIPLMPTSELRMMGRHNQLNALAALAMGTRLGFELPAMRRALRRFAGLVHRGELIAEIGGIRWINDSKGTNVGATLAAIDGIGPALSGKLIWLGGGLGKGADFTPLAAPLRQYCREAIVFGADASRLAIALDDYLPVIPVDTLNDALERAAISAKAGDCVLLSPACASLDQFANYMARGEAFRQWVERYLATQDTQGEA